MSEGETTEDQQEELLSGNYTKIIAAAIGAVVVLSIITIAAYQYAKKRSSTVVLPGGTTYLGPTPGNEQKTPSQAPSAPQKFTVSSTTPWVEFKGKVFPYTFSYPNTLTIVVFPNDQTDAAAFSWNNTPPQQNILVRVSDITKTEPMSEYVEKPKIDYVKNWYKQYSGLKGVQSVEEFVNAKGMKGYKAKYMNWANEAPNDDVFFEVPDRPELMVRFGNGLLDSDVFDRIVDSFNWNAKTVKPTTLPESTPTE